MEGTVITMPAVALRGLTVFPTMMIHFDINRKRSIAAVEKAMVSDTVLPARSSAPLRSVKAPPLSEVTETRKPALVR